MSPFARLIIAASSAALLVSCTTYRKVPEAQNKAICQAVPAQGSPLKCAITKEVATVLPEQRYGKWTMVTATLTSPPGTKITRAVFRRDLCSPQGCVHAVPCLFGCGARSYPNDGFDYSKAGDGVVQWWGRVDNDDPEGWLFDVHYQ
jgi:hypothetical protein